MLRVNTISNVNNTLKNISFKAGVQTNYGVQEKQAILLTKGILTGFVGVIKRFTFFNFSQINSRAESIKNGVNETKKLDMIA